MVNRHKTKRVILTEADVDINIIPVVNFINSLNDCMTIFSCEGYGKKKNVVFQKPYVLFFCHSNLQLQIILNKLGHYGYIFVELHFLSQQLRYHLEFHSKDHLHRAVEALS